MTNEKHTKPFYDNKTPDDWEEVKLKDIGKISSGTTPLRSNLEYHTNGNIPWVKTTDLNNSIIIETEEKITERAYKETSLKLYPKDTILVAMYGGFNQIGRTGILGIEATINQALSAIIVDKSETDPVFLLNWLNAKVDVWKNFAGSSRKDPNITSKDVSDFPFIKIPLPEQRAIALLLSTWDKAIAKTQALIAQKELRKKWLMQQLLTGKKRLKGFYEEWKEYHLGELFTERTETMFNDLPLLSVGQNGIYPQIESSKKDTSNEDKSKYKRICPDDIGYNTMRMWQGRNALSSLEGIVSPAYTILTPNENVYSLFFSYLFKTQKLTNIFWRNSQGLVDDTLNCRFNDFRIIKVHLPNKEEQTAIARVLQAADKEIQLLKAKAEKLKAQKRGLMQLLLTGKKRLET
jgi:type I restriction enzyme, S subunit